MKKIINKKYILGILTGIIICGVTVYAVTYEAKDIKYKNNISVKDALDDLYTKANKELEFSTAVYAENSGNNESSKSVSLNLEKGKYIVSLNMALSYLNSSSTHINSADINADFVCSSNNCSINKLSYRGYDHSASVADSSYNTLRVKNFLYYIVINDNTDIITFTSSGTNQSTVPKTINIHAVRIND